MAHLSMVQTLRTSAYELRMQNIEPTEHRLTELQYRQLRWELGPAFQYEIGEQGVKFEGVPIVIDESVTNA